MELLDFAKTNTAARLRAAAARGALSHALIFSGSGDRLGAARYAAAVGAKDAGPMASRLATLRAVEMSGRDMRLAR